MPLWESNHGMFFLVLQVRPKQYHDATMVDAKKHGSTITIVHDQNTMVDPWYHGKKHGTFSCRLVFVDIGFE